MIGPYTAPLRAHVVEGDIFVADPDDGSNIWMSPEAVLESLKPLKEAACSAIEARIGPERSFIAPPSAD